MLIVALSAQVSVCAVTFKNLLWGSFQIDVMCRVVAVEQTDAGSFMWLSNQFFLFLYLAKEWQSDPK